MTNNALERAAYAMGTSFTLASAVLWGSTYPVVKLVLASYSPLEISLFRSILASLTLTLFFGLRGELQQMLPKRNDLGLLLLASLLGATGFWTLQAISVNLVNADATTFLTALYPLIAIVFAALLLGERAGARQIAGVVLGIVGTYIIVIYGKNFIVSGKFPVGGFIVALGAAFSWAGYMIVTRYLTSRKAGNIDPRYVTLNTFLFAIPFTLVMDLFVSRGAGSSFQPGLEPTLLLVYLGVLTSAVAFLIFNLGMKILGVGGAAINQLLFPVVGVVSAYFLLGQTLDLSEIVGMMLIGIGILLAQVRLASK
jgi:drug/metabolite transporter (DMT)-like permease